jgi:branched-chain amino acid aminotransferase
MERLYSAMKFLKIRQPLADKEAEKVIYELLKINNLKDAYIRVTVSRGESEDSRMDISKSGPSNVVVIAREYNPPPDKCYEKGVAVNIARSRRNSQSILSNFKVLNYLDSILARNEAYPEGFFDAIFLNEAGYISEASTSNVFIVSGNRLATPSLDCGVLPGITRKVVLELSRYAGVGVSEGKFLESELKNGDEAFITNSMFEIIPVVKIDDKVIGSGFVGRTTRKICNLYKDMVRKETEIEIS